MDLEVLRNSRFAAIEKLTPGAIFTSAFFVCKTMCNIEFDITHQPSVGRPRLIAWWIHPASPQLFGHQDPPMRWAEIWPGSLRLRLSWKRDVRLPQMWYKETAGTDHFKSRSRGPIFPRLKKHTVNTIYTKNPTFTTERCTHTCSRHDSDHCISVSSIKGLDVTLTHNLNFWEYIECGVKKSIRVLGFVNRILS